MSRTCVCGDIEDEHCGPCEVGDCVCAHFEWDGEEPPLYPSDDLYPHE